MDCITCEFLRVKRPLKPLGNCKAHIDASTAILFQNAELMPEYYICKKDIFAHIKDPSAFGAIACVEYKEEKNGKKGK